MFSAEFSHSTVAIACTRFWNLRPKIWTSTDVAQRNDRLDICVVQIFQGRRGTTSRRPQLQARHRGRGTSVAGRTFSGQVEGQGLRASCDPRSTNWLRTSSSRAWRLADTDCLVFQSIHVLLHELLGTCSVCRTQWRSSLVHGTHPRSWCRVFERIFTDRGHGDSVTVRPRHHHHWHVRMVDRLVCQRCYDHTKEPSAQRLIAFQTNLQNWPLQAELDWTVNSRELRVKVGPNSITIYSFHCACAGSAVFLLLVWSLTSPCIKPVSK